MPPFTLHSRAQGLVSLMAAAVTSLAILGSVVYLFVSDDAVAVKPAAQLAKSAPPSASAPLAGPLDPY